jgi:signal transduction histidine kinase
VKFGRSPSEDKSATDAEQSPRARRGLPVRLLFFTIAVVVVAEALVQIPNLARERRVLLDEMAMQAYIAALSPPASAIGPTTMQGDDVSSSTAARNQIDRRRLAQRDELLRASGIEAIRLRDAHGSTLVLVGDPQVRAARSFDLRTETPVQSVTHALSAVLASNDRLVEITTDSSFIPGIEIQFIMHSRALTEALRAARGPDAWLTLLVASAVGLLMYAVLLIVLVRPMRRLTSSISAFRADPEHGVPLDSGKISVLRDDEISIAARELAIMQRDLRAALWRNSRLAALGTVVAKVSHDVRGILTPALLHADRLERHGDQSVRRAGEAVLQAVDRVIDLVQRTLDFARDGPPPPTLSRVCVRAVLTEAADSARSAVAPFELDNCVPQELHVEVDRTQLFRVLVNLLRNAVEAGASRVRVWVREQNTTLMIEIADDGPGLPERVRANLFRPFATTSRRGGAGLGLAIARDLMLAHGGDLELVATGRDGTTFRLVLPMVEQAARVPQTADPV